MATTPAPVPQARQRRRVELDVRYACELCPRTYGSRAARRVHVLLKHRVDNDPRLPAPAAAAPATWRELGFDV